jgi:hypothetical protein
MENVADGPAFICAQSIAISRQACHSTIEEAVIEAAPKESTIVSPLYAGLTETIPSFPHLFRQPRNLTAGLVVEPGWPPHEGAGIL